MSAAHAQAPYLFLAVTVLLGLVVLPVLLRRRAGQTLFDLGRPKLQRSWDFLQGAPYAVGAAWWTLLLIYWARHASYGAHHRPLLAAGELVFVTGGPAVAIISYSQARWRITERGFASYFHSRAWEDIASYAWDDAPDAEGRGMLTVSFTRTLWLVRGHQLRWSLPQRDKRGVLLLLQSHLGNNTRYVPRKSGRSATGRVP